MYKHDKISYLDYVDSDFFNRFLLNNAMKMLGYLEQMRYLYRVEKEILSDVLFWLVTNADFKNLVKLLGEKI